MSLLQVKNLSIAFGIHHLLDQANFVLKAGERVGLLGRNGEGKSTFLKILADEIPFDEGEIQGRDQIRVAKLDQAPSLTGDETIYAVVASGLGKTGELITHYRALSSSPKAGEAASLEKLAKLQNEIEHAHAWPHFQAIEKVLSRLGLDADQAVSSLSGGWQRRVSLARALVIEPDVLLLDEPTNHLDIESIQWLEGHLMSFTGAIVFVTHDRAFLDKMATRIVDLDRGQLVSWPGNYSDYLRRKAAALEEEERQNALFDKKLAQEEQWIRQGIKARRTRNEGRVRALKKMRAERADRRSRQGNVKIKIESAEKSGKRVIEAEGVDLAFGDKIILKDFSTSILRGDRIGLIGPNGVGKTTLIKVLLGQLAPDSGSVKVGTNLEVAYFDQLRNQLDMDKTVVEFIGEGREQISINDKPRHVISYLSDFLFTPARARSPISSLSGGEKARVLLAHLFSKAVNMLVMDEPTNDLDIETLELLEELLLDFKGTLLLVSHDRQFMDNVITGTLVFEGEGQVSDYVGGYSDWADRTKAEPKAEIQASQTTKQETTNEPKVAPVSAKKLSYKLQCELDALPEQIEKIETEQSKLTDQLSDPTMFSRDPKQAENISRRLTQLGEELEGCYARWDELDG